MTVRRAFQGYLEDQVIGPIAAALGGHQASRRAAAAAAVIVGVFMTRYVVRLEPLASMSRAEVTRQLTPVLEAGLRPAR